MISKLNLGLWEFSLQNQKVQLKKVLRACKEMNSNLYHIALETKELPKPTQQFYLKATDQWLEQWSEWNPIAESAFENPSVKEGDNILLKKNMDII